MLQKYVFFFNNLHIFSGYFFKETNSERFIIAKPYINVCFFVNLQSNLILVIK